MKNKSGIYRIINIINGRYYIGSSNNVLRRFSEHKRDLQKNKHYNYILQKSWNKHGENSFLFEIIEIVENIKELTIREQFYLDKIKPFNSKITYNICPFAGSIFGVKLSEETRNKMRKSHLGMSHKDETILKMIKYKHGHSEETKIKLSEIGNGKEAKNKAPIYQLDLDGNIIKKWNSITEAANNFKISPSLICSVCNGRRKTSVGFKWIYVNKPEHTIINIDEIKDKYSTGLYSTRKLSKLYNISKSKIWNIVK